MFKIKKLSIVIITILYIILTLIELVKYLCMDSNTFGLIYLLVSLVIIFLLVPVAYNYKRHFSKERISKLIIIILLGVFNSFIISNIVLSSMNYSDTSTGMINNTFIIRVILKTIIYVLLGVFTIIESNLIGIIRSKLRKH